MNQLKKDFLFIEVDHFRIELIEIQPKDSKQDKPTLIYLSSLTGLANHVASHIENLHYILYQYDELFLTSTMLVNYVTLNQ